MQKFTPVLKISILVLIALLLPADLLIGEAAVYLLPEHLHGHEPLKSELRPLPGSGSAAAELVLDSSGIDLPGQRILWRTAVRPAFSRPEESPLIVSDRYRTRFKPDAAGEYLLNGYLVPADTPVADEHFDPASPSVTVRVVLYQRKSLAVAIDGVRPDVLFNAPATTLLSLVSEPWNPGYDTVHSFKARTVLDANPNSGTNHASIMTGVNPKKHGVFTNSQYSAGAADIATWPHYLDVLELHRPELKTAFLTNWGSDYTMITRADYRRKGEGTMADSSVREDRLITGYAAAILSGEEVDIPGTDGTRWEGGDIDALFLFLGAPDTEGHGWGLEFFGSTGFYPHSEKYLSAVREADRAVALLMESVRNRPSFAWEEWQFLITTDHGGFGPYHGYYNAAVQSIWFLHTARQNGKPLPGGELPGMVGNVDFAPTVLDHFGFDTDAMRQEGRLDGQARTAGIAGPGTTASPTLVTPIRKPAADLASPEQSGSRETPEDGLESPAGEALITEFDADGFSVVFSYEHPWDDLFRNRRPLIEAEFLTVKESGTAADDAVFGIFSNYQFWTGIGGRQGKSDGTITYDRTDTGTNRSLGTTGVWGTDAVDIYTLMPEAWRRTFLGLTVDGEGRIVMYADRSDGMLYFVTGLLPAGFIREAAIVALHPGSFVSDLRAWDRELSVLEMFALFGESDGPKASRPE